MRDHHLVGWNGNTRLDEIVFLKRLILLCRLDDSLFYFAFLDKLSSGWRQLQNNPVLPRIDSHNGSFKVIVSTPDGSQCRVQMPDSGSNDLQADVLALNLAQRGENLGFVQVQGGLVGVQVWRRVRKNRLEQAEIGLPDVFAERVLKCAEHRHAVFYSAA